LANQLCRTIFGVTLKAKSNSINAAAKLRMVLFLSKAVFETLLQKYTFQSEYQIFCNVFYVLDCCYFVKKAALFMAAFNPKRKK